MTDFTDALVTCRPVLLTLPTTLLVSFLLSGMVRADVLADGMQVEGEYRIAGMTPDGRLTVASASDPETCEYWAEVDRDRERYCELPEPTDDAESLPASRNPFGRTRTMFDQDIETPVDAVEPEEETESPPEPPNPFGRTETMGGQS